MMLVTVGQLENKLRTSLDYTQAEQEITLASGVVADWCNLVNLEVVTDDEIVIPGSYGPTLLLPGGPVSEVSEVTVDGDAVSDYWLVKDTLWRGRPGGLTDFPVRDHGTWVGPDVEVAITYTHGLATVPAGIQAVVLNMAARSWSNPAGTKQQTIDGYSVTWENGTLAPHDKVALRRYHRSVHSASTS